LRLTYISGGTIAAAFSHLLIIIIILAIYCGCLGLFGSRIVHT
jgi:hypothetical protein